MTELIGVDYDAGKALFSNGEKSVVVDISNNDVHAVLRPEQALLSSAWLKVAKDTAFPFVWKELADAAVTQLAIQEESKTPGPDYQRRFRVPQNVKEEASQATAWANGFERGGTTYSFKVAKMLTTEKLVTLQQITRMARFFANQPQSISENSGFNDGDQGYPSSERIKYSMWGGEPCREWVSRICKKHGLTASGEFVQPMPNDDDIPTDDGGAPPPEVDGDSPHHYEDDPNTPGECLFCGRAETDPVHIVDDDGDNVDSMPEGDDTAADTGMESDADYFAKGVDPDTTEATGMYKHDADDSWSERVDGDWQPTEAPADDEVIIMLDPESADLLQDILDNQAPEDPSILPYELAMINPHEAALFAAAWPELDWDLVDRMFDIYDSQERSINAGKQVRGQGGKFGGSADGPAKGTPEAPKARMPQALPLVPDTKKLIDDYLASIASQRGETPPPAATPAPAPPTPPAPTENATGDPGTVTDVRPLYLAEVDTVDTQAVLDVFSIVPPAAGTQGDASCWKRNAGTWVAAPDMLAKLRGTTPPPIVELKDDDTLKNVLDQVDKATSDNAPEPEAPSTQRTTQDGEPIEDPVTAGGPPQKEREKLAKKGMALPDGSFPIRNESDLKKAISAYGRAKNQAEAKRHIMKRARGLGRTDLIPDDWKKSSNSINQYAMWGPSGEIMNLVAGKEASPADIKATERLRRYWVHGEGAAKIRWGEPNDWYRCVSHLSKYLGTRAKGYCTLRHKDATGFWPGHEPDGKH